MTAPDAEEPRDDGGNGLMRDELVEEAQRYHEAYAERYGHDLAVEETPLVSAMPSTE